MNPKTNRMSVGSMMILTSNDAAVITDPRAQDTKNVNDAHVANNVITDVNLT